jgi:hypothetical protein
MQHWCWFVYVVHGAPQPCCCQVLVLPGSGSAQHPAPCPALFTRPGGRCVCVAYLGVGPNVWGRPPSNVFLQWSNSWPVDGLAVVAVTESVCVSQVDDFLQQDTVVQT